MNHNKCSRYRGVKSPSFSSFSAIWAFTSSVRHPFAVGESIVRHDYFTVLAV